MDVSKRVFDRFDYAQYSDEAIIKKNSFKFLSLSFCALVLILFLFGTHFYLYKNRKTVERKDEIRTIEIERDR